MHLRNLAFSILVLSVGCADEKQQIAETPAVKVRCAEASIMKTAPSITTFGTVLYYSKADVYPTTEGYIEKLYAGEGDYVKAGEKLAKLRQEKLAIERDKALSEVESKKSLLTLSDEKLKEGRRSAEKTIISIEGAAASASQRKKEFENMKRIFSNKKQLFEAGGLSPEELESVKMSYLNAEYESARAENELNLAKTGYRDEDIASCGYMIPDDGEKRKELLIKINTSILEAEKGVAEAQLNSAVSELQRIDLLISETVITSPISGIIGKRNLDIGEKVQPDTSIFTVFQNEKVFIRVDLEENRALEIKKGDTAELFTDHISITGKVHIVSPVINPETRSREIKIIAENPEGALVPGSFIRVRIKTGEEKQETVIPGIAITRSEETGKDSVYIIREGRAFRKEIKVSFTSDEMVVIKEGIKPGEMICLDPPQNLGEGKEVTILK